ncbi:MAG: hypothetical protein HY779_02020 [Rubrobacteridae bacterium]|nr:hypothetical protein [Rubrobacteridae bacterium]
MKKNVVVLVVVVLLAGVGGFFGGMTYQKSQATTGFSQIGRNFQGGAGMPGGNGTARGSMGQNANGFGRPVDGEIIDIDDTSMTVKSQDGSTKIVVLSSKTKVNKATTISLEELKKGENVMVIGTTNSDGSVSAESISIGRLGFGRPIQQQPQPPSQQQSQQ